MKSTHNKIASDVNRNNIIQKSNYISVEAGLGHIIPMKAFVSEFKKKHSDEFEIIESDFYREDNDFMCIIISSPMSRKNYICMKIFHFF